MGSQGEEQNCRNALLSILKNNGWVDDVSVRESLRPLLASLCYFYLVEEKYSRKQALNRVANFHLRNGAQLEQINWMGNSSPKGLCESAGLMVNYKYCLDELEVNSAAYSGTGDVKCANNLLSEVKSFGFLDLW